MSLERYFTPVQTDRDGLVRRVKQLQFHLDFFMNQGWWGGSWESEPLCTNREAGSTEKFSRAELILFSCWTGRAAILWRRFQSFEHERDIHETFSIIKLPQQTWRTGRRREIGLKVQLRALLRDHRAEGEARTVEGTLGQSDWKGRWRGRVVRTSNTKVKLKLGVLVYACNLSTWESEAGGLPWAGGPVWTIMSSRAEWAHSEARASLDLIARVQPI